MLRNHSAALVSLLALAVVGCSKSSQDMSATTPNSGLPALPAALPMQTGPATPLAAAPPVSRLPAPRRALGVSRFSNDSEAYAYLDRAADMEDEIGDAPPDYDYDYDDGTRPWVWETRGGDYQYAEPVDGGYRYYYYQPGADYPYLVRTSDRTYAYAAGALVAIYALSGALLPPDQYGGYRDQASRFFYRGQQLRQGANQYPHQGVNAANWAAQRPQISAAQATWASARAQQPAWQAYHASNDPTRQPGWQQEHQQRQQVAQQFNGWQAHGLSGPPPKALAVAGARAAAQPGPGPAPGVPGRPGPAVAMPSRPVPPAGSYGAGPAHPGLAGPEPSRGPALGRLPGGASIPAAGHEQHLAGPQHPAASSPNMAPQESAARQQQIVNVHRQEAAAAQEQVAGPQQAQRREAAVAAQQAQLHAMNAQRQAENARMEATRNAAVEHAARTAPPVRERPPEMAPRPEARPPAPAAAPAPRPIEARPPAPRPEPPHPAPGHEEEHH